MLRPPETGGSGNQYPVYPICIPDVVSGKCYFAETQSQRPDRQPQGVAIDLTPWPGFTAPRKGVRVPVTPGAERMDASPQAPQLSLVIPAYNEPAGIWLAVAESQPFLPTLYHPFDVL